MSVPQIPAPDDVSQTIDTSIRKLLGLFGDNLSDKNHTDIMGWLSKEFTNQFNRAQETVFQGLWEQWGLIRGNPFKEGTKITGKPMVLDESLNREQGWILIDVGRYVCFPFASEKDAEDYYYANRGRRIFSLSDLMRQSERKFQTFTIHGWEVKEIEPNHVIKSQEYPLFATSYNVRFSFCQVILPGNAIAVLA